MKVGKYEIKARKENPVLTIKKDDKTLMFVKKNENKKPIIKHKKALVGIVSGALILSIFTGGVVSCVSSNNNSSRQTKEPETSIHEILHSEYTNELDFKVMNYGNKTFLTLDEQDLLGLIIQAMKEVDEEYVNNGNTSVFSKKDNEYSRFTSYDILSILQTESSYRLLEIKDKNKSIFNVNNYARFYGEDEKGVIYYGPGMINKETINYIVDIDRKQVNGFDNIITINNKKIEINFENLNPYDYIINSGAKTQEEIKKALENNILLNAKCVYIYLNRIVKDNVKEGSHDNELQVLQSYGEFKNLTTEEKQIVFALIGYNNGPSKTREAMLTHNLFAKYTEGKNKGKYIINVRYAKKVMDTKKEYLEQIESYDLIK